MRPADSGGIYIDTAFYISITCSAYDISSTLDDPQIFAQTVTHLSPLIIAGLDLLQAKNSNAIFLISISHTANLYQFRLKIGYLYVQEKQFVWKGIFFFKPKSHVFRFD